MADPKEGIVDEFQANLNDDALTKKDASTHAKYLVMYEKPPWTLIKDFIIREGYDLIISVGRKQVFPKRFVRNIPLVFDGRFPIGIWTVDKPDIDGDVLKFKADDEIRRVIRASGKYQLYPYEKDDDHTLDGIKIYNRTLIIKYDYLSAGREGLPVLIPVDYPGGVCEALSGHMHNPGGAIEGFSGLGHNFGGVSEAYSGHGHEPGGVCEGLGGKASAVGGICEESV